MESWLDQLEPRVLTRHIAYELAEQAERDEPTRERMDGEEIRRLMAQRFEHPP